MPSVSLRWEPQDDDEVPELENIRPDVTDSINAAVQHSELRVEGMPTPMAAMGGLRAPVRPAFAALQTPVLPVRTSSLYGFPTPPSTYQLGNMHISSTFVRTMHLIEDSDVDVLYYNRKACCNTLPTENTEELLSFWKQVHGVYYEFQCLGTESVKTVYVSKQMLVHVGAFEFEIPLENEDGKLYIWFMNGRHVSVRIPRGSERPCTHSDCGQLELVYNQMISDWRQAF